MSRSAQEIQDWIRERVSRLTGVPAAEIDPARPITRYGLDSFAVVAFAADLEAWLGYRFRENPFEDHPTIQALAQYLAEQVGKCS
jgi:acyl carrier protein